MRAEDRPVTVTDNKWLSQTAHRLGLAETMLSFSQARVGQTLHIPCARGHTVDFTISARMHPNGVAKQLLNRGWTIGRRLLCPDHTRQPKPKKPTEEKDPIMAGTNGAAVAAPAVAPSEAAKKAHRLVMMYLEEQYDEGNKRYRPGWSDEKIADETGASPLNVKATREQYFGPLGQPPELDAIKAELTALEASVVKTNAQHTEQIAAAKRRIADVCRINGWPVE
jgi:hypothetical protein